MDKENDTDDDIIFPDELRDVLQRHGLLGKAAREFGLEYLECMMPESYLTPHAMDELDWRVADMGLTGRQALELGGNSRDWGGGGPFDPGADSFAGDADGLVSIAADRLDDYVEEALGGGDDDEFIRWLSDLGRVDAGWVARRGCRPADHPQAPSSTPAP